MDIVPWLELRPDALMGKEPDADFGFSILVCRISMALHAQRGRLEVGRSLLLLVARSLAAY